MNKAKRLFDVIFRDKTGKVVILQAPNTAIMTYFALVVTGWFLPPGIFRTIDRILAFASLSVWAMLEIFDGASYFRRILGGVVLLIACAGALYSQGVMRRLW
jgi:hypothetical protein